MRAPHALLLAALLAAGALAAGCADSVDPTLGLDVPFSLYGYLDPTADRQAVRVVPIADRLDPDASVIDAAVTSTDLGTGATTTWRDSLVTFDDGSQGHVFVADLSPRPGSTVRLEARRSDGAVSSVEVEVPPIVEPVVDEPLLVGDGIGYAVRLEGAPHVINGQFFITVGGHPDDPPGRSRRVEVDLRAVEPVETSPGVWAVEVPFVTAVRRYLEANGLLGLELGLSDIEYSFFVTNEAWDPPTDDVDALVEPGTFSNVEAGLGFVGAGYATGVRWQPSVEALVAAGFGTGDDPALALVMNEVKQGATGAWVEFYNPTLGGINLRGYTLTGSTADPDLQRLTTNQVVPPSGFLVIDLDFPLVQTGEQDPWIELALFNRTGDLVRQTRTLPLAPDEGGQGVTYGSYPDGYSYVVREMVGLEEKVYDVFRGPLRPTRGRANEFGLDVAVANEIYTEGAAGWVEVVPLRSNLASLSVLADEDIPGASFAGASPVVPLDGPFGVADERPDGLPLVQGGGRIFVLAQYLDDRVRPKPGDFPPPLGLDPRFQIRAVDARDYGGQTAGRSVGYLPDAPGGTWTPDLRPTRGAPNAAARLGL